MVLCHLRKSLCNNKNTWEQSKSEIRFLKRFFYYRFLCTSMKVKANIHTYLWIKEGSMVFYLCVWAAVRNKEQTIFPYLKGTV